MARTAILQRGISFEMKLLLKITVPVVHDLVGDNTLEAARCGYQSFL